MKEKSIWTTLPKDRLNGYATHLVMVGMFGGFVAGIGASSGLAGAITSVVLGVSIVYFGLVKGVNNKFPEFKAAENDFIENQREYIEKYPERFPNMNQKNSEG